MPLNGFRLLTLGRLALEGAEGDPAADALRKQRRKLVVLAVLALAGERLTREALAEMFWGDQDEGRARHSLSEALSHLRRVLGASAIAARGPEVVLSPGAPLTLDAREFLGAVKAGRSAEALALYGGPFLDGLDPGGSRRLEAWLEAERGALERSFAQVCEQEYSGLRGARRWEEAGALARRWLEADPLSEAAALALLSALEGTETSDADARALREYRALRARLERDYGVAPGPRVEARAGVLMERLGGAGALELALGAAPLAFPPAPTDPSVGPATVAAGHALAPVAASMALLAPTAAGVQTAAAVAASLAPSTSRADSVSTAGGHPQPQEAIGPTVRPRRWLKGALVGAAALAAVVLVVVLRHIGVTRSPATTPGTIAVLPFPVAGPAEYAYLGEGVVDLLSADLDGAGPYRTVNPQAVLNAARAAGNVPAAVMAQQAARRLGADLYLAGNVVVAGGRVRLSAKLFRPSNALRPLAEAAVEGAPGDLFRLVDRLTADLLAASGSRVPPLGRLAALTTTSLPALKHYLEGESDLRRGLSASAFDAFRAAVQEDSTFALAHFGMAQAGNWGVPIGWSWDSIAWRYLKAASYAGRLPPRARLLVDAYAAWVTGSYDEAERGFRAVLRSYPDDVEAWTGLGEVMFHMNPMRGRPFLESGPPFERVLALEPDNLSAMTHLLRVRLRERRPRSVDSLVERLDFQAPAVRRPEYHVLRAFTQGTAAERERALQELRESGNDEMVRISAHRLAVYGGDLEGAARVLTLLLDRTLPPDVQAHARIWLAELEVAHGRWRAAEPHLAAAAALDPAMALEERALLAALPFGPPDTARMRALESALEKWPANLTPATSYPWVAVYNGLHEPIRQYLLGVLALRRGDAAGAERHAAALNGEQGDAEVREFARGLAESLRGHALAQADPARALSHFEAAHMRVSEGLLEAQFGSQALERWTRAELLVRLGRSRQALPWFASLPETLIDELIYLAPAELRQAQIYDRLGNGPAAVAHYRRFVELWRNADPEVAGVVQQARQRLSVLQPASAVTP